MYVKLDFDKFVKGEPQPEGFFDNLSHKEAYSKEVESGDWEERLNELLEYLTVGKLPEGVHCKSPKMSLKKAESVIWFLQEVTKIIPDEYEICAECGEVHNSGDGKHFETNGKFYCGDCFDYAPVVHCEVCGNEAGYKKDTYSKKHEMYLCEDCRKEKEKKQ